MWRRLRPSTQLLRRFCATSAQNVQDADCVVIGAGVIGLACARSLALAGREVIVLERAAHHGTETSARHSEVIHAGLYYPSNSLKARLCVEGKHMLYDYLKSTGMNHRNVTKLVVATTARQIDGLHKVKQQAEANGVNDLVMLSGSEAMSLEPNLHAAAALLSPSTGIMDSHSYMSSLLADLEAAGGTLAVASAVVGGSVARPGNTTVNVAAGAPGTAGAASGHIELDVKDLLNGEVMRLRCKTVINAAGLWAQQVSTCIQGIPSDSIPRQYLARGVYFSLSHSTASSGHIAQHEAQPQFNNDEGPSRQPLSSAQPAEANQSDSLHIAPSSQSKSVGQPFPAPTGNRPFSRLIYPLPEDGGLGTHLTLDMSGGVRFGPDVEWVNSIDYKVEPSRATKFYPAIRTFWPGLPDASLQPAYAGVRPKLSGPGQPGADFMIQGPHGPQGHGVPGLVCLYGIESPGLTSSLAIAEYVRGLVVQKNA